jgi:hypothetical protein
MKQQIIKYFLLTATVISLYSCTKDPETEPRYLITDELVWDEKDKNATVAQFFLNDVYNYLPGGFERIGGDFLDAGSGDAISSRNNTTVQNYYNGTVSVINNPDPYWGNSYYGIRKANIFLKNIDRVPALLPTNITYWKAEARFIRAMLYFELLKRYGGVPLIGDTLFTINDNLEIPRNTYEETVNYIVSECNSIKDSLRKEPIADNDWGRIPRGAAIALKCRTLLYAASPLYNGGGTSTDATKKSLSGYPTYDASRWQKVIDAAEELRALNYYALQTSYTAVFTTKKNTEIILAKQGGNNFALESINAPIGFVAPAASQGRTSPTQNFVDAFTDTSGLVIGSTGSVYNAATPYEKRDPRFKAIVFFNGSRWLSRNVETFEGGRDKPGGNVVQTKTGYYMRKFLADFSNNTTYTNQSHNFVLFRYAETLLNYAEALNEMGRVEEAVTQIIAIRRRAGIVAGTNSRFGIKAGITQGELRTLIQNERRIELSFEEHRMYDVRRWKIADQALSGPLFGMKITKTPTNTFTYERVQVANMVFQSRLYYLPLPYAETTKNLKLIQNEGW